MIALLMSHHSKQLFIHKILLYLVDFRDEEYKRKVQQAVDDFWASNPFVAPSPDISNSFSRFSKLFSFLFLF